MYLQQTHRRSYWDPALSKILTADADRKRIHKSNTHGNKTQHLWKQKATPKETKSNTYGNKKKKKNTYENQK